jgi:hypothetical protein
MVQRKNSWLLAWFGAYFVCVGVLFFFLPRLLSKPYLMPWHYSPMFLFTPFIAMLFLGIGVRSGRFSGWAVGLFFLAAIGLGLGLYWIGLQLLAAV